MVPVCDKRYHIYNRFRHFWAEIKKLWNYPLESRMERKRKALGLETKYEIINEFEKSGKSKIEIAKHYDIP